MTGVQPDRGPVGRWRPAWPSPATNFTGATAVDFGVTAATSFNVASDTSVTAVVPAGSAGAVDVTVTTPIGTSATSSADVFTYEGTPTVTASARPRGRPPGGTSVTITGTNLADATGVDFGTSGASVTADSATSITATSPAGTGMVDVTVTTPVGTSATSPADEFTYIPAPTVTGVSPSSGLAGVTGAVTITGTNLSGATSVKFGTHVAGISTDTAGSIDVVSPIGTPGTVDVTVTTAGGTSATSAADRFTFTSPAAITSASSATFTRGPPGHFTVTATGLPTPTLAERGALPGGVHFDASTGVLSGTPTAGGTFPITFTATNGAGSPASQAFTLTVKQLPLVVTTSSLPGATVGTAYAAALSATGGSGGNVWSVSSGALPAGLTLDRPLRGHLGHPDHGRDGHLHGQGDRQRRPVGDQGPDHRGHLAGHPACHPDPAHRGHGRHPER